MSLTQKNVLNVLVGGNVAGIAIASVQVTDPSTAATYISNGQVIALGLNVNTGVEEVIPTTLSTTTGAALYPSIRLVANNNGQLNYSARIYARDVNFARGIDGVPGTTEQISTVGYNGTSGSIDISSTDYTLTYVGDWDDMMWSEQKYRIAYNYNSTSPTQQGCAQKLSADFNFSNFRSNMAGVGPQAKVEVLSDGTAASPATAVTIAVVNGSDVATLNAADAGIQVVGTVLRLGNTTASATGRGTTVPVYIVKAIPSTDSSLSAAQVRLHTFFQGTSDAVVNLTTDAGVVASSTNWGLKFTGLPLTWGLTPYSDYKFMKVSFHLDLKGFGATTYGTPTQASKGQGDYREVAQMESFAAGNEGALNRTRIPLPTGRHYVDTTGTIAAYDIVSIQSQDKNKRSAITAPVPMGVQTFVAIPDGATSMTKLLTQLNPWLTAAGVINTNITV